MHFFVMQVCTHYVPISGWYWENISSWYDGPTVMEIYIKLKVCMSQQQLHRSMLPNRQVFFCASQNVLHSQTDISFFLHGQECSHESTIAKYIYGKTKILRRPKVHVRRFLNRLLSKSLSQKHALLHAISGLQRHDVQ